jgi:hypothetical protein
MSYDGDDDNYDSDIEAELADDNFNEEPDHFTRYVQRFRPKPLPPISDMIALTHSSDRVNSVPF